MSTKEICTQLHWLLSVLDRRKSRRMEITPGPMEIPVGMISNKPADIKELKLEQGWTYEGRLVRMWDTVKQTTPEQGSQSDAIQWEQFIKEKDTRVGNGLLKSEYSHLFPEQPNLEDKIYCKGGRFVTPRFLALSFFFWISLSFYLEFLFPWLCGLETWEDLISYHFLVACHSQIYPKAMSFPS